jgi:hypothetical protein
VPRTRLEAKGALADGELVENVANAMRWSHRRLPEVGEAGRDEGRHRKVGCTNEHSRADRL